MKSNKTKWVSELPTDEGWYWVKYRGKNGIVICPASISQFPPVENRPVHEVAIRTARNVFFTNYDHRGLKIGPKIEEPE